MIIRAAVTHSNFKKSVQISLKNRLLLLATPTSATTDATTLKFFPDTIQLLKANSVKQL